MSVSPYLRGSRSPNGDRKTEPPHPPPPTPAHTLSTETVAAPSRLTTDFAPQSHLHMLWRSTVVAFSDPSVTQASHLVGASRRGGTFLRTLQATDLKSSHASRRVAMSRQRLRLNRVFSSLGPAAKLKTFRHAGTPVSDVNSFFRCAAQLEAIRGVRLRYRPFASAIRPYFSFCEL